MPRKLIAAGALVMAGLAAAPSQGATVTSLTDNFESDTEGLNSPSLNKWTVANGTVDLLGPALAGGLCFPETGNKCVDLDGSTSDAGDLVSKDQLATNTIYELSFQLEGSQRGDTNSVTISLGGASFFVDRALTTPLLSTTFTLGTSSGALTFTVYAHLTDPGPASLAFSHAGGDNIGLLLDNVSVAAIPLPAAAWLFGSALAGLGALRLRRRQKTAA